MSVPGVDWIRQAIPDQAGLLIFGSANTANGRLDEVVLLLDRRGAVIDRWTPKPGVLAIFSDSGRRSATLYSATRREYLQDTDGRDVWPPPKTDRIVELLLGGKIEDRDSAEPHATIVSLHGGQDGKGRVDCVGMNLTKEHYRDSYCLTSGPGGWREFGLWNEPVPFACGPFLIELFEGGNDIGRRGKGPRVTVRRLDDGQVAGERALAPGHALACGKAGELLLAKSDVQAWSLPRLKTLWRVPSGHGRSVAVAADNDQVLVATPTGTVFSLSPTPARLSRQSDHSNQVNHATH
ncbi:MAG TPA: hypothetical protein VH374_23205 [Polyangia bacterium]|nr:hypothetical protein [Polyangia bacterium]